MSLATNLFSIVRRIAIVIVIAVAFLFGVVTTVYLSLRSPEVKVPDVMGKDRFEAEKILASADLNFRIRATRPSNQSKPDTVLFQLPRPGEVVKAGQTVAMDISRAAKEGEATETVKPVETDNRNNNTNTNSNSSNTNENKPKPKPRNTNANNSNSNNSNSNSNSNRSTNSNRTNTNGNTTRSNSNNGNNANATPRANSNRTNSNTKPGNQNENRRPATPRPTPTSTRPPV